MIKTKLYTGQAKSAGGRDGHISTDNGALHLSLNMKNSSDGTNPEQLFAAGYAACFESTLQVMADRLGIKLGTSQVNGLVDLGTAEEGGYEMQIQTNINGVIGYEIGAKLEVSLPDVTAEEAEKLMALAHENCPYSKATRDNIDVQIIQIATSLK